MTRYSLLALCLCLITACEDTVTFPDCEDLVLTTANGEPDPCDLQACEAAFGDGCHICMVNQSLPQQYVDDDGTAWDLFEFCPDWRADTGSEG